MLIRIPYGDAGMPVEIPDFLEPEVLYARYPEGVNQPAELLEQVLDNPIGSPPLEELATRRSRVAVIVDDATRPTPTPMMLRSLYHRLLRMGVDESSVTVVVAYGAHQRHDDAQTARLLGADLYPRLRIVHHDARDEGNLVSLGRTERGTPIRVNRAVAEADLRILTGSVKPHNQAGYTGGGKAIVPGAAGIDTISANHSSHNVSHPRSVLGALKGNPIREDINEVVERFVGPSFLLNVIMNPSKDVVGAVSGHPVMAHKHAAAMLDSMCRVNTSVVADTVIVGCPDPVGINLYQTMNAMSAPVRVENPVVKKGGYIIVASRCKEGIGHPEFLSCITGSSSVQALYDKVTRPEGAMLDRYACQIWAETLLYANVILVTEGVSPDILMQMHVEHANTIEQALELCVRRGGSQVHVTVIPDAPYVIPACKQN